MLVAVPEFKGRVSPTFDFCHRLTLWRVDSLGCRRAAVKTCKQASTEERAGKLQAAGVEFLLCGAMSGDAREVLERRGIAVVEGLAGPVEKVVAAFMCGALDAPRFRLPGFERAGVACFGESQVQHEERRDAGADRGGVKSLGGTRSRSCRTRRAPDRGGRWVRKCIEAGRS